MRNIRQRPTRRNSQRERFDQSSFESAARIDSVFLKTHPGSKKYRRNVIRGEIPDSLRDEKHIRTVFVYRIADGVILYAFANARGAVAGQSLFLDNEPLSTAGRQEANFCLNLFKALSALKSGDER
jgi:hypothetical protein